jgi:hypothetical protein
MRKGRSWTGAVLSERTSPPLSITRLAIACSTDTSLLLSTARSSSVASYVGMRTCQPIKAPLSGMPFATSVSVCVCVCVCVCVRLYICIRDSVPASSLACDAWTVLADALPCRHARCHSSCVSVGSCSGGCLSVDTRFSDVWFCLSCERRDSSRRVLQPVHACLTRNCDFRCIVRHAILIQMVRRVW